MTKGKGKSGSTVINIGGAPAQYSGGYGTPYQTGGFASPSWGGGSGFGMFSSHFDELIYNQERQEQLEKVMRRFVGGKRGRETDGFSSLVEVFSDKILKNVADNNGGNMGQGDKRQLDLLKSISNVVDLAKITIGFETLGVDVVVQMQAYADHALPWSTANPKKHQFPVPYDQRVYYQACTQNMTDDNWNQDKEMRCGSPVAWQQW